MPSPDTQGEVVLLELSFGSLPTGTNLTNNISNLVPQGMSQLAWSGTSQTGPLAHFQTATRGLFQVPSSDPDTEAEEG